MHVWSTWLGPLCLLWLPLSPSQRLLGYQEGASAEAGRADYLLKIASDLVKRFSFFSLCLILETNFTLTRPAAILQLGLKRKKWLATPLKADVENSTRSFSLFFFFFQHSPRVANSLDSTREDVWNSGYRELKQRRLMHVNQIFYNNWANPRPLIGRELWFMRV